MALLHHAPASTGGRRIFLALPCYGQLPALTAFCLFKSHPVLINAGFEVELGLLTGNCHVDDARNVLVRDFLKTSCEQLVFIDADIGWQPNDLVRLLNHDRDVVGASYPLKQSIEEYPCRFIPGEIWSDAGGLIEVDGVPTGFLKIKRLVLEKLFKGSRKFKVRGSSDVEETAEIFERGIVNGGRISGDYNFCRKWRGTGGQIFVDPEMYLEHVGEKTWEGSLGSHLRRKNGLSLTRALKRIAEGTETHRDLLELLTEWGNNPWAAGPELLSTCAQVARQVKGPIIETGSGLSSLIMAAANPGVKVHALEHDRFWYSQTAEAAKDLPNLAVHFAPLTQYRDGRWYSDVSVPWDECAMVLCDGPPRQMGNREILFDFIKQPRCILLDDTPELKGRFADWAAANQYQVNIKGKLRKFAVGVRQ